MTRSAIITPSRPAIGFMPTWTSENHILRKAGASTTMQLRWANSHRSRCFQIFRENQREFLLGSTAKVNKTIPLPLARSAEGCTRNSQVLVRACLKGHHMDSAALPFTAESLLAFSTAVGETGRKFVGTSDCLRYSASCLGVCTFLAIVTVNGTREVQRISFTVAGLMQIVIRDDGSAFISAIQFSRQSIC